MGIKVTKGGAIRTGVALAFVFTQAACSGGGIPDLRPGLNDGGYAQNNGTTTPPRPETINTGFDPIADALRQAEIDAAVNGTLATPTYTSGPDFSVVHDGPDTPPQRVYYTGAEPAGSILLDDQYNKLYVIEEGGTAVQYSIGMGREGHEMPDVQYVITHQKAWPSWTPTPTMRNAGQTVPGGENNPLGAHALYLAQVHADGSTEATYFRIHGTNDPDSIGHDESSGCVRMHNRHVQDLAQRVDLDDGVQNFVRLANAQDLRHFSRIQTRNATVSVTPYRPPNRG